MKMKKMMKEKWHKEKDAANSQLMINTADFLLIINSKFSAYCIMSTYDSFLCSSLEQLDGAQQKRTAFKCFELHFVKLNCLKMQWSWGKKPVELWSKGQGCLSACVYHLCFKENEFREKFQRGFYCFSKKF